MTHAWLTRAHFVQEADSADRQQLGDSRQDLVVKASVADLVEADGI
jgi:hypothetical protein